MRDRGNTGTSPAAVCFMAGNGRLYCEFLDHLLLYTIDALNVRLYEIDLSLLYNNSFMMY